VTLVQAVSRGERMDWTLQKATELGVRRIQPVLAARSVVRLDERQGERRLRHWQAVVASACEQCGRSCCRRGASARAAALSRRSARREPADGAEPTAAASVAAIAERLVGNAAGVELLIGPEAGWRPRKSPRP